MLRIDDTDAERSEEKYVEAIKEDLQWLGLDWDKFARQSERMEVYDAAVEKLKEQGRLYACYETEQELEIKRKMLLSRGRPPIYDREGLKLTDTKKAEYEKAGRKPHWRFKLNDGAIEWDDEIRGFTHFLGKNLSDPILIRENGEYTYMLPSTVDDIDLGVTNVIRGEDHVSNTAIQIEIFDALGGKKPLFAHNALIKTKEGKLSKRKNSDNMKDLRQEGIEPMAINSFLAKVGTSDPIEIRDNLEKLIAEFDIKKFGRAPTIYSLDDIRRLNEKLLHHLPFDQIKSHLANVGVNDIDEEFWLTVRPNVSTLGEAKQWHDICNGQLKPLIEDKNFAQEAANLLPEGKWNAETWNKWVEDVKNKTGRKGKDLFMPLRKALTGLDHGPELKELLPLIGREKAIARLSGKEA